MIREYEEHIAKTRNKLEARIAAADVKGLVNRAKWIEFLVKQKDPTFQMTWRSMTMGLILGYFEHKAINYDNTYYYLNRMSSNIVDFFEWMIETQGYDKENPAIEAQRALLHEATILHHHAERRYRELDANLKKAANITAASIGRKPARSDESSKKEAAKRTTRKRTGARTRKAA